MKNIFAVIFITFFAFIFLHQSAYADLVDPKYYTKTCPLGEIEVECRYQQKAILGRTYEECTLYENNPNYRFLTAGGPAYGGSQKYCFKPVSTQDFFVYHIKTLYPLALITLLLEIPIFLKAIGRNRKTLLTVLIANLISISLFYFTTTTLPFRGFFTLIVMELIVVIFEALFIRHILKNIFFRHILIYSLAANATSAILGSMLLNIISSY